MIKKKRKKTGIKKTTKKAAIGKKQKKDDIVFHVKSIDEVKPEPARPISNFWRRYFAFVIDLLILGAFGAILGLFFSGFFESLAYGRLLGLAIAVLYFGLMNSSLCNGQTLAKKLLKIKVIDNEGNYINPGISLLRSIVLLLPYFLNNMKLPCGVSINMFISGLLIFIVFGMGSAIIYLYVFNTKTRQSLHDILFGTYVVYKDAGSSLETYNTNRRHYIIAAALAVLVPLLSMYGINKELSNETFRNFSRIISILSEKEPCVVTSVGESSITINGKSEKTVVVDMTMTKSGTEVEDIAGRIAKDVAKNYKDIETYNGITIKVTRGYDIGIMSFTYIDEYEYTVYGTLTNKYTGSFKIGK